LKIGKGLVFLARDPRLARLLPEGAAEISERLLLHSGFLKPSELSLFDKRWFRSFASFVERHTMPGGSLSVVLRKRFFDDEIRAAIGEGATQVLVVGAGFDTLALRLAPGLPKVTFVEVDYPATHEVKRTAVEAIGCDRPNLHLIGADLASERLEDILAASKVWRPDGASVVLAEGVLMYLDRSAVSTFLESVQRSTGRDSRLLFTTLRCDDKGHILAGRLSFLTKMPLQLMGEPWRWGIREEELGDFLTQYGFRLERLPGHDELRRRYLVLAGLDDESLGNVEYLAVAKTQR
jgi:methyltransferase (TIGR00027 family)